MDRQYTAHCIELCGTNYSIGNQLGTVVNTLKPLKARLLSPKCCLSEPHMNNLKILLDRFCPGLNEELQGFADANKVKLSQVLYYAATYIVTGCSQFALTPKITECNHVLLARNYDYFPYMDDWVLSKTHVNGKYAHIGTNIMQFGRGEGMNECGLAISHSACGYPLNSQGNNRPPIVDGLQFWAVVRAVLENTKNLPEALSWLNEMPIACNANFLLADKAGNVAIVEIFDNQRAIFQIGEESFENYLAATNHIHLPELKHLYPFAMKNSLERMNIIQECLNVEKIKKDKLKSLLLTDYPKGLKTSDYQKSFGTIKSMVEMCWGGLADNQWRRYDLSSSMPNEDNLHLIVGTTYSDSFFKLIEL